MFNINEVDAAIGLAVLGLLVSFITWAIHIKVRHDILENNYKNIKEIEELKQKVVSDLNKVNLGLVQLKSTVADTLMSMVEQKFVREEIFRTRLTAIEEKIESVQEVIHIQMQSMNQTFETKLIMLHELMSKIESKK